MQIARWWTSRILGHAILGLLKISLLHRVYIPRNGIKSCAETGPLIARRAYRSVILKVYRRWIRVLILIDAPHRRGENQGSWPRSIPSKAPLYFTLLQPCGMTYGTFRISWRIRCGRCQKYESANANPSSLEYLGSATFSGPVCRVSDGSLMSNTRRNKHEYNTDVLINS